MNTREELLSGLGEAVNIIRQLASIQQRLNDIRGQYGSLKPLKKMSLIGKIVIGIGILCVLTLLMGAKEIFNLYNFVLCSLIYVGIPYAFFTWRKNKKNAKTTEENDMITAKNERLKVQEQDVLKELQQVQVAYRERLSSWYPENYCSVDAVEFFYNAITNYRADNLKEAINLYENTMHQRRVEANQQQAINQQKLNNLLSVGNIVMQGATIGAINNQTNSVTNAVKGVGDTLNSIRRGY